MHCVNKETNSRDCPCTYSSCSRKGVCCECVKYHLSNDELPGCFFPPEAEKTYNRSREYYISLFKK
ncbi:MAG: DUF6485 family protein [Candidatus Omnitrophica bacterium]|nr:DUF6485 family protein [Candidatus Omnitrophota bacterium]MDD5430051.1 DUF6485 family protein [Candidatus Omnitrophota bacterium]